MYVFDDDDDDDDADDDDDTHQLRSRWLKPAVSNTNHSHGMPRMPPNERDRSRSPRSRGSSTSHELCCTLACLFCRSETEQYFLSRDRYTKTCVNGPLCCCEVRCSRCHRLFCRKVRGSLVPTGDIVGDVRGQTTAVFGPQSRREVAQGPP